MERDSGIHNNKKKKKKKKRKKCEIGIRKARAMTAQSEHAISPIEFGGEYFSLTNFTILDSEVFEKEKKSYKNGNIAFGGEYFSLTNFTIFESDVFEKEKKS